jgi:hypothetical protein
METNIPMGTKEIVKIKIGLCYLYLTEIEHSFKKFDYLGTVNFKTIHGVDVVEWSRALDVRLSEWCCSVSMV